jgi:hypothetical protein
MLAATPDEMVLPIWRAVDEYTDALEANAVTDDAVATDPARHRRTHLAGIALTLALIPPAVAGAIVNLVPAAVTHVSGRHAMAPVTRATAKFLVALIVLPLTWVVWRYTAVADEPHPWLTMVALGSVCGLALSWVADRLRRGRRARVDLRELAGVGASLAGLRARRERVVDAVHAALADRSR